MSERTDYKVVGQPLTISPASRRGLFGIGGYLDEHARMWMWPVVGGQITYANGEGTIDIFRVHDLDVEMLLIPDKGRNTSWYEDIVEEMGKIKKELLSQGICYTDPNGRVIFNTRYDFERFLNLNVWQSSVLRIYERFPRGAALYSECFYASAFMSGLIPWRFTVQPGEFEVYIEPPRNSLAGLTRVRINKGVFLGYSYLLGFNKRWAAKVWEMFYKQNTSNVKLTSVDDIINLLSKKSMNPLTYVSPNRTFDSVDYTIMAVFYLKIYEQTRQSLDLPDWKFSTKWHTIVRGVADAQIEQIFKIISDSWTRSQVLVPDSDLKYIAENNILPITNDIGGYNPKDLKVTGFSDIQGSPESRIPVVDMVEIKEEVSNEDGLVRLPVYKWVEIYTYNPVQNVANIAYNRLFGNYHAASLEGEAQIIIDSVFPQDLYTEKPQTVGMKLEPRHWKIIFETYYGTNPIGYTSSDVYHFLFGQASIYGPNHYLITLRSLSIEPPYSEAFRSNLYGLPNVISTSKLTAFFDRLKQEREEEKKRKKLEEYAESAQQFEKLNYDPGKIRGRVKVQETPVTVPEAVKNQVSTEKAAIDKQVKEAKEKLEASKKVEEEAEKKRQADLAAVQKQLEQAKGK